MNRQFKFLAISIQLATLLPILVGCNTNYPTTNQSVPSNATGQSQVHGDVLTLAAHSSKGTIVPSLPTVLPSPSSGSLRSDYGMIRVSTTNETRHPLRFTLTTKSGRKSVVFVDRTKVLKQLLGWQTNGRYVLLNIGDPVPNQVSADFTGHAIVIDLKTSKVIDREIVPVESQKIRLYIANTDFIQQWFYIGRNNSYWYVTHLANLKTGLQVTMQNNQYYPLGTKLDPEGDRVYFVGKGGVYVVDIPAKAWISPTSTTWYSVVLNPPVNLDNRTFN